MKDSITNAELVRKFSKAVGGVFQLADLKGLFPSAPPNVFYRKVADLERAGILKRFARGIYLAEGFDIAVLSQKLCPVSYVSFETVLAKEAVIGTIPSKELKAVKIGKKRKYSCDDISIVHFGLDERLFFGFENVNGVNYATKEKALLDTLYFYMKGAKYYFDIYSDVNINKLDMKIIDNYLKAYKNPKFVRFVRSYAISISK